MMNLQQRNGGLMYIGFTGTRRGLKVSQVLALTKLVEELGISRAFHGDCKGGDAEFDIICEANGIFREIYPGSDRYGQSPSRAYCQAEVIHRPLPYITRDKIIVERGRDGLIGCPDSKIERKRSGTWTTVRYGRQMRRKIWLVFPDGSIKIEGGS